MSGYQPYHIFHNCQHHHVVNRVPTRVECRGLYLLSLFMRLSSVYYIVDCMYWIPWMAGNAAIQTRGRSNFYRILQSSISHSSFGYMANISFRSMTPIWICKSAGKKSHHYLIGLVHSGDSKKHMDLDSRKIHRRPDRPQYASLSIPNGRIHGCRQRNAVLD